MATLTFTRTNNATAGQVVTVAVDAARVILSIFNTSRMEFAGVPIYVDFDQAPVGGQSGIALLPGQGLQWSGPATEVPSNQVQILHPVAGQSSLVLKSP